jgi:hypothetical protein
MHSGMATLLGGPLEIGGVPLAPRDFPAAP